MPKSSEYEAVTPANPILIHLSLWKLFCNETKPLKPDWFMFNGDEGNSYDGCTSHRKL